MFTLHTYKSICIYIAIVVKLSIMSIYINELVVVKDVIYIRILKKYIVALTKKIYAIIFLIYSVSFSILKL